MLCILESTTLSKVAVSDIWRCGNLNFNKIYQHFGYINGWVSLAMDSSGQLSTIFHLSSWKPGQKFQKLGYQNITLPQVGFFDFSAFKSRLWALNKKCRPRFLMYGVKLLAFHPVLGVSLSFGREQRSFTFSPFAPLLVQFRHENLSFFKNLFSSELALLTAIVDHTRLFFYPAYLLKNRTLCLEVHYRPIQP